MGAGRIQRAKPEHRLALPRIGQIKIGYKAKNQNGKEYPASVDYFIPTGKYATLFTQAYGERPNTIQVVFPTDDAALVCNEEYVYRDDAGRKIASGDGHTFACWNGKEYQTVTTDESPNLMAGITKRYPRRNVREGSDGWDATLTLNVVVPAVAGVAGVWQFVTKGTASTIPQIRDVFDAMIEARGSLRGVLFDLCVAFAKSNKPGDSSRYPVVTLVPNQSRENVERVQQAIAHNDILGAQKLLSGK